MGIFEELAEEFGIGKDSPEARLAADLAAADEKFMQQLVQLRHVVGLTQDDLGIAWGRHKTAVSQFERPGADPRLSTVRRYAASIGARYIHLVVLDRDIHRRLIRPADPLETFVKWEFGSALSARKQFPEAYRLVFDLPVSWAQNDDRVES